MRPTVIGLALGLEDFAQEAGPVKAAMIDTVATTATNLATARIPTPSVGAVARRRRAKVAMIAINDVTAASVLRRSTNRAGRALSSRSSQRQVVAMDAIVIVSGSWPVHRPPSGPEPLPSSCALEEQAVTEVVVQQAPPAHGQAFTRVTQRDSVEHRQVFGEFVCPGEELGVGEDLTNHTELECLLCAELLAGEQEVATSVRSQKLRPDDVHTVPGDRATEPMRAVLEDHVLCTEHDVREQGQFGMDAGWAVHGSDDGDFDLEKTAQQALPLPVDLVPSARRRGERAHALAERIARAGQDDDPVVIVVGDIGPECGELAVRRLTPDEGSAIGVQSDFEDPLRVALEDCGLIFVRVLLESRRAHSGHRWLFTRIGWVSTCRSRAWCVRISASTSSSGAQGCRRLVMPGGGDRH